MSIPPGDEYTASAPVPARTWHGRTRFHTNTLTLGRTDGGDLGVQLWVDDGDGDSMSVLLDRTQIDELITDLVERRALLATRRAGSGRFDR